MYQVIYTCPSSPIKKLTKKFQSYYDAETWAKAFRGNYGYTWYLEIVGA